MKAPDLNDGHWDMHLRRRHRDSRTIKLLGLHGKVHLARRRRRPRTGQLLEGRILDLSSQVIAPRRYLWIVLFHVLFLVLVRLRL